MTKLFVLYHVEEVDDFRERVKTLGVFDDKNEAVKAKRLLMLKSDFLGKDEGFLIDCLELNHTNWKEGYGIN
ncbi:hypothetical protein WH96_20670 [Kiloniella spongiae]|uniref:DUF7336 domain-containing protein n=2 Tax=Kiloniella spongiae TaxID=1489064 RepID=A0A0H2M9M9_9PROT|nr:hypothetical protein WH96_20670 [Kiloniella spongiae]